MKAVRPLNCSRGREALAAQMVSDLGWAVGGHKDKWLPSEGEAGKVREGVIGGGNVMASLESWGKGLVQG